MGGFGSSRWEDHVRARPVENCLPLDCARLKAACAFEAAPGEQVQLRPKLEGLPMPGAQSVRRTGSGPGALTVQFRPFDPAAGHPFSKGYAGKLQRQRVQLLTTRPHFGGVRYWIACPACEKRKGVLWLPPYHSRYRCRTCHELTYRSCQQSHADEARWRTPGASRKRMRRRLREAGYDPAAVLNERSG